MAKRIVPFGVVSFVFVAACVAACQSAGQAFPDAPSAQARTAEEAFGGSREEVPSPWKLVAMSSPEGGMRPEQFASADQMGSHQESKTIFEKYLRAPSAKPLASHYAAGDGSLMGRAAYAASRIFVTRDESGKGRFNTSYLLRALTSMAADTASRPYWRRSAAGSVSDFGSTVGNDAGMNVWHEFQPGIEQLMKSHAPRFVTRIEERIGHK
jgi:hypothetical protein